MGLTFLSIQGLSVSYGGKADVLRDVSLDVQRGEVIGLIGPSGSRFSGTRRANQANHLATLHI